MPVVTVTYYICSRCRHQEEAGEVKAGYGATTPGPPMGWTKAGFLPNANSDLCRKCSEELKSWFEPREDRGL